MMVIGEEEEGDRNGGRGGQRGHFQGVPLTNLRDVFTQLVHNLEVRR